MEGYHEIIKPVRDIVRGIGEFVIEKIIPGDVLNGLFTGVQEESIKRTAEFFQPPLEGMDK